MMSNYPSCFFLMAPALGLAAIALGESGREGRSRRPKSI
jgi:hypothetical protein